MTRQIWVAVLVATGVFMVTVGAERLWANEPREEHAQNDISDEFGVLKERLKAVEERIPQSKGGFLGRFGERLNFQGDLRLRSEFNRQPGFVEDTDRFRQRFRLRLGLTGQISDSLMAGIRLGSGDPDNVSTAEVNLGDDFSRKTFLNLDQAFLRYTPNEYATTTAGKFAQPWWRPSLGNFTAEVLWDNDVQPEGIVQAFDFKNVGPLDRVRLTGATMVLGQFDSRKIPNPGNLMFGGQGMAQTSLGDHTSLTLSTGYFSVENPDSIATGKLKSGRDGPGGNFTNKLAMDAQGNVTGFASDYKILDVSGQLDWNVPGWLPMGMFFEYTKNFGANSSVIGGTEIGKENDAFLLYATLGKLKKPGDWLVGYGYGVIEADAALSQFNSDDLEFTNTKTQIVFLEYSLRKNMTLIWDSYLQRREDDTLSLLQGNSSTAGLQRVKSRINFLVKF